MPGNGPRLRDKLGDGAFGASRGSRPHRGRDILFDPGAEVPSLINGKVVNLGYPYADDKSYRYVEVLSTDKRVIMRAFYVHPSVKVGDSVQKEQVVGVAQNIAKRYGGEEGGMGNHVHYELFVDPLVFVQT
jgi:hypothetical protein